jgi:disulfide bond formation protein DsbB
MYPLVLIFAAGLFPLDKKVIKFSSPLTILGLVIAFYHNLLYYKILPESAAPCKQGISCTTVHIEWLGFVTIPLLSFLSFLFILVLSVFFYRKKLNEE